MGQKTGPRGIGGAQVHALHKAMPHPKIAGEIPVSCRKRFSIGTGIEQSEKHLHPLARRRHKRQRHRQIGPDGIGYAPSSPSHWSRSRIKKVAGSSASIRRTPSVNRLLPQRANRSWPSGRHRGQTGQLQPPVRCCSAASVRPARPRRPA